MFQVTLYGPAPLTVPSETGAPGPASSAKNWTLAMPEPPSLAFALTVTLGPCTLVDAVGAVTDTTGCVLSTCTLPIAADVVCNVKESTATAHTE